VMEGGGSTRWRHEIMLTSQRQKELKAWKLNSDIREEEKKRSEQVTERACLLVEFAVCSDQKVYSTLRL